MPVKKLCLGDTVVFDRDEIMDAIFGLTPALSVVMVVDINVYGDNWVISENQGDVSSDTSKLYRYLMGMANNGSSVSEIMSNGERIYFKISAGLRIITDAANAQLAREEFERSGVSWYWCIHELNKVRLPVTKHFINFTDTPSGSGNYSKDQIVEIEGNLSNGILFGGGQSPITPTGAFKDTITYVDPSLGTSPYHRHLTNNITFKASNSPGVNVGQWVQPRATALRLAFYVGFLKQSQYKDL